MKIDRDQKGLWVVSLEGCWLWKLRGPLVYSGQLSH